MKPAIIFAIENSNHEPNYEYLSCLLAKSIRLFHKDVDIYCGVFSDKSLSKQTINILERLNVKIVHHIHFKKTHSELPNCLIRLFCQYYFYTNLQDKYEYLIYLDVDILLLKPINFNYMSSIKNNILTYDWPKENLYLEEKSIKEQSTNQIDFDIDSNFYLNIVNIISKSTGHIIEKTWESINIKTDINNYNWNVKYNSIVDSSNVKKIHNSRIVAFFPNLPVTDETVFFHYDGIHERSTLNRIKDISPVYSKYMEYINEFGIIYDSDGLYYEKYILNNFTELFPYIIKNKSPYNRWLKNKNYFIK
jgi:hypothetical protein